MQVKKGHPFRPCRSLCGQKFNHKFPLSRLPLLQGSPPQSYQAALLWACVRPTRGEVPLHSALHQTPAHDDTHPGPSQLGNRSYILPSFRFVFTACSARLLCGYASLAPALRSCLGRRLQPHGSPEPPRSAISRVRAFKETHRARQRWVQRPQSSLIYCPSFM